MLAKPLLRATVKVATSVQTFDRSFGELDLTGLVGGLSTQVDAVLGGDLGRAEEMLLMQAQTLETNNLSYLEASETYMRLGPRAQSQCRATLETLGLIKNPTTVVFVQSINDVTRAPTRPVPWRKYATSMSES